MTETGPAVPPRMPGVGRLLAAQIGYQSRLLAGGRTITIGIGLPIILLIGSHQGTGQSTAANVAQYGAFGLSLTAWNTYGVRLVAAREAGVLKRWWATPLPRWCYFLGRILATVVVGTAAGAATVAAGVLLYNTPLTVTGALGVFVAFVLGSFAWAAAATALTAAVPTLEAAAPTFMLVYFPVVIVSGVLGGISEPHWLSTIASYLPAKPLAQAAGTALGHTAGHAWLPAHDLAVLAGWAIAGIAIAVVTFKWEPHRPTQRRPARTPRRARAVPLVASSVGDGGAPATAAAPLRSGSTTPGHGRRSGSTPSRSSALSTGAEPSRSSVS